MNNFKDLITNRTQKLVYNEKSQFNDNNNQEVTDKKQMVKHQLTSTNINKKEKKMMAVQQNKLQYSEINLLNHYTIFKSKQITKIEDYMKTTSVKLSEDEYHTSSFEIQKVKSPITILNDWSRLVNKFRREDKTFKVIYMFLNISGYAHKPVFTYRCQVYDITAEGNGFSKKEAKQNSASQLLTKLRTMDIENNINDVIKSITTIGNNNNMEINENKSENEISTGEPLMIDDHSDKSNKALQLMSYEAVKLAHCNLSPISALHELIREYKWKPPIYTLQKLDPQFYKGSNRKLFEVTCRVVHLETKGTSNAKQEAKRISSRLMFHKVRNLNTETLNIINKKPILISNNKDNQNPRIHEEFQKRPLEWDSAHYFRSFFITAVKNSFENVNYNQILEKQKITLSQYQDELEQYIINNDAELNNVDKLEIICHTLDIQTTYVIIRDAADIQLNNEHNNNLNKECAVLLQVTTIPISLNIGYGLSVELATENAAKNVICLFKMLLIHSLQCTNIAVLAED